MIASDKDWFSISDTTNGRHLCYITAKSERGAKSMATRRYGPGYYSVRQCSHAEVREAASLAAAKVEPNYDEQASAEYNAMTAIVESAPVKDVCGNTIKPNDPDYADAVAARDVGQAFVRAVEASASPMQQAFAARLRRAVHGDVAAVKARFEFEATVRRHGSLGDFVRTTFRVSFSGWPTPETCLAQAALSGFEPGRLFSITLIED